MRYKKTPWNQRTTYKMYDDNNKLVTEYKPGKDGVTEADILMLHRIDDSEVNVNCRERKLDEWFQPIYDKWKEKYIEKFKKEYGYEPPKNEIPGGHRILESVDFMFDDSEDEYEDKNSLWAEIAEQAEFAEQNDEKEISSEEKRLHEIIAEMPEIWQHVYELVLLKRMTRREAGRIIGISESYVGRIEKRIIKTISEDKKLIEILH